MKLIPCFLLLLCAYPTKSQPVTIGNKVADISFTVMVNGTSKTTSLHAYKEKLLILDFWATWCTNCIKKFPELNSLKANHAGDMEILLITSENNSKVQKLFAKLGNNARPQVPVVINDTAFAAIFPHRLLPHYVWLNSDHKVIAITGAEEITGLNIAKAINGNLPALAVKEDIEDFNRYKPLFINGNGGSGSGIRFRSTLSANISGLPSGGRVTKDSNGLITRILATNTTALQLLVQAYRPGIKQTRFHYSFPDSNRFIYAGKSDTWLAANTYTYELIIPPSKPAEAYRIMQQDMQRYFGLSANTETRPTPCLLLTADTAILSKFAAGPGPSFNHLYESAGRNMENKNIATLAAFLEQYTGIPVVDESCFSRNICISLPGGDMPGLPALQNILLTYGIRLTPAQRMLANFIIHQKN